MKHRWIYQLFRPDDHGILALIVLKDMFHQGWELCGHVDKSRWVIRKAVQS